jgi:hypothetical protein
MLNILFSNIKTVFTFLAGICTFVLFSKNSRLKKENDKLLEQVKSSDELVKVQKKVIHIAKNTKSTDIDGTLERMRKGKL